MSTWDYMGPHDPDPIPEEWIWERLRMRRDNLLKQTDWTQVVDSPVDQEAWAAYRQSLRDLPASTKDPRNAAWPQPPLA